MKDENGYPIPLAEGRISDEYGESATMWALYSADDVDVARLLREQADADRDNDDRNYAFDLASELTGWSRHDGGPGRWFWSDPWVRIVRRHVLVKCSGGLDI